MTIRIEKKYTFNQVEKELVRDQIFGSQLAFSKTYEKRSIHSLYFDTHDYSCYNENLSGVAKRIKIRLRWYNQIEGLTPSKVIFEIKVKSNIQGNKLTQELELRDPVSLRSGQNLVLHLRELLPSNFLPYFDNFCEPTLLVSYNREYYEDQEKRVRVTIDDELLFSKPSLNSVLLMDAGQTVKMTHGVIEVKTPYTERANIDKLFLENDFIRSGRHSKYSIGVASTRV